MKKFISNVLPADWKRCVVGVCVVAAILFFCQYQNYPIDFACVSLCVGIGYLISLRKWNFVFSAAVLIPYIIFVPNKLYIYTEMPVHSMENLEEGAIGVSVALILALYLLFYVITQRIGISLGITSLVLMVFSLANYYVYSFRGSAISFADIAAVRTALLIGKNYDYSLSEEMVSSLLQFALWACLGFKINISSKTIRELFPKYRALPVRIFVSACSAIAAFSFFYTLLKTPFLEDRGLDDEKWAYYDLSETNGLILYPFVMYRSARLDKPEGYSEASMIKKGKKYSDSFVSKTMIGEIRPNIIMIMDEAFSDLRVLGEFEVNDPYMPFLDSIYGRDNAIRGNLYMPVYGGHTVNSEFEALTGNSMFFLSASSIPYQTTIKSYIPSLVSELETLGYSTTAMHPNVGKAYNRENVYNCMGFDDAVFLDEFAYEPEMRNDSFTKDKSNFREIIRCFEERDKEKPFFLFDVTIQNHSPYWEEERTTKITSITGVECDFGGLYGAEETYLDLVRESDEALRELCEYFERVDEPTVICFFGDHQPFLTNAFYDVLFGERAMDESEKTALKHIVPYAIIANYDIDIANQGDFGSNYLSAVLLDVLGLPISQYYKFLLQAKSVCPIISEYVVSDPEALNSGNEAVITEILNDYRAFQYDSMFDKKKTEEVFEPEIHEVHAIADGGDN